MPVYKLPLSFLEAHRAVLEAHDWVRRPALRLSDVVPDAGFAAHDVLEAIARGGQVIVRSRHPGTMRRLRLHADRLHRTALPEDVAAILKARNPSTEAVDPGHFVLPTFDEAGKRLT